MEKFTVKHRILQDSIGAVGSYRTEASLYKPAINGGVAVQLYADRAFPDLLRPTHDMDVVISPRLTADSFRFGFGRYLATALQQHAPNVDVLRHVYEVKLSDEDGSPFFVHSYKWTVNGFEREERNLKRQVADANTLPAGGTIAYVVRPEEIVIGKLRRLKAMESKGNLPQGRGGLVRRSKERAWEILASQDLPAWLQELRAQKAGLPAHYDRGETEFKSALNEYVGSKDLFDIAVISKLLMTRELGFDDTYYSELVRDNAHVMSNAR